MTQANHRIDAARGFSLIELLIAIAIIAILAGIAVPSYQGYVIQARRTDAIASLTDLANRLERYYTETNTYATATLGAGEETTDVLPSANSSEGLYTLSIEASDTSATIWTIRATATGVQSSDTACGNFQLSSIGRRTVSGTESAEECWGS